MPRFLLLALACLVAGCGTPTPKPPPAASASAPPLFDDLGDLHRDIGTPVPAVTRTCSTPGTWLTEVPRNWRTPSAIPFIPWMYASPS